MFTLNAGITQRGGKKCFYIPTTGKTDASASFLKKLSNEEYERVVVRTLTASTIIRNYLQKSKRIGLWIDVEGTSFAAISSLGKEIEKVVVIKVEMEIQRIWRSQKSAHQVLRLLLDLSFVPLICLPEPDSAPRDWVFVRLEHLPMLEELIEERLDKIVNYRVGFKDLLREINKQAKPTLIKSVLLRIFNNGLLIHKVYALLGSSSSRYELSRKMKQ